jgi:PleD family two-component response regulator
MWTRIAELPTHDVARALTPAHPQNRASKTGRVDLSIGCVAVPPETETFEPLIDQADHEMYRRKRALAS